MKEEVGEESAGRGARHARMPLPVNIDGRNPNAGPEAQRAFHAKNWQLRAEIH
jgi:hypothetical protein